MTGVFEVIASDDSQQVVAGRKAVALAAQRVNERFAKFLRAAEDRPDLEARLALIENEMNDLVTQTCRETGYDGAGKIARAIWINFRNGPGGDPYPVKTASMQFEARKPKMCPYHKEVTAISLAQGDPKAGFEAMAQHAWGKNHCDGEFEGSCNFRPEMTTQTWWDDRDKAIQERREQRDRERAEAEQAEQAPQQELEQVEDDQAQEPVSDSETPQTESDPELGVETESPAEGLTEAPEGVDGVEAEVPMAMAASFQRLAPGNKHLPGASPKQNSQYEAIKRQCLKDGGSEDECKEKAAKIVNSQRGSSEHTGEAVETIDVGQRKGPSPKIDKRKWTPENLQQRVQTEGEGSPNPTEEKDVTKPIRVDNSKPLSETGEATTEKQDVSKDTHPTPTNRRTWPTGEISAVSSSQPDVNENPLQKILESDENGFVPQAVVERAASAQ